MTARAAIIRGLRRVLLGERPEPLDMSPAAQLTRLADKLHASSPAQHPRLPHAPDQPEKKVRPHTGPCPLCRAPENKWCWAGCAALDPMDYR